MRVAITGIKLGAFRKHSAYETSIPCVTHRMSLVHAYLIPTDNLLYILGSYINPVLNYTRDLACFSLENLNRECNNYMQIKR